MDWPSPVTVCDFANDDSSVMQTGVLGARCVFYVSPDSLRFGPLIWAARDSRGSTRLIACRSMESDRSAMGVSAVPSISFILESEDKHLNVLVRTGASATACGGGKLGGDVPDAAAAFPLQRGTDSASSWVIPVPKRRAPLSKIVCGTICFMNRQRRAARIEASNLYVVRGRWRTQRLTLNTARSNRGDG